MIDLDDLSNTDLATIPHDRLVTITGGLLRGFDEIARALQEETTLHSTVRSQRAAIASLNETVNTLNQALADATSGSVSNEECFRAALEEIRATLERPDAVKTRLDSVTAAVDAALGGSTNVASTQKARAKGKAANSAESSDGQAD